MNLSDKAILEISDLSFQAESLARGTASQRAQASAILARISTIRQIGISSDEIRAKYTCALTESLTSKKPIQNAEYRAKFDHYISGRVSDEEFRDFLAAGTQTISWTAGATGGFLVPTSYDEVLREAMAQTDPVLDETVTSFSMTDGPFLQPEQVSGYDLSTAEAQLIGESAQQNPQVIPPVLGSVLRNNLIFKASFAASIEAEADIPNFGAKITRAASVALARRIGQSVTSGRGGADIAGVVQMLGSPSINNQTSGKLTLTDFNNILFSINRWYRAAPKCGWLMNDAVYKYVRAANDNSGRPLLDVVDDREMLLGKPIYISPSLATSFTSLGVAGVIVFGDLGSIVVKCSRPMVQRHVELGQADVTRGECLFTGRARCDSAYFDPSSGVTPPLVLAAIS